MSTEPRASSAVRLSLMATKVRSKVVFVALDGVVIVTAYFLALVITLHDRAPANYYAKLIPLLSVALVVQLVANRFFGLYGRIWKYAGIDEARNIVAACLTTLVIMLVLYPLGLGRHVTRVPLIALPLGCVLTMLGIGVLRFHSRLLGWQRANRGMGLRVGVVGSKDLGAAVIRDMSRNPTAGLFPVAVFDEDRRTHGLSLMGIPVVGGIDDIPLAVEKLQVQQILLAVPNPSTALVERCLRAAEDAEITMKIVPDLREIVGNVTDPAAVSVRAAREPRIEDLLGRREVTTDLAAVRRALEGRRVLVTGAGGSIGSEICRQVANSEPEVLIMLDHDETHLHDVASTTTCKSEQILADVSCREALAEVFTRWRPEVVFHAAAHKHVPILETHVVEAVTTNVMGTLNVIELAAEVETERFVFISTDKAVRPASVMGATKRLGEQLLADRAPDGLPYCAVRFGNVLGSRGSVIPTFRRQIAAGGPVTVTDPHMTRYFMSVEEAVQLVLQASVLAERGDVYMLEMGEPLSILELAHRMIRLSGFHPGTDIRIRITGPRVGEKIHEHLHNEDEHLAPTEHPSILRLERAPQEDPRHLSAGLAELWTATEDRNEVRARRMLFDIVSEDSVAGAVDGHGIVGGVDEARERGSAAPFAVEHEIPA
jgi:FlaA1/EpsC-like NDP-sugar epimerase